MQNGAAGDANGWIFHGVSFRTSDSSVHGFGLDDFEQELRDESVFSWIDIEAQDIRRLNEVLVRVGIDLKLVDHFDSPEVLPRIVERSDCLAFYLYEIADPERHLDISRGLSEINFARMLLVLGHDYVITYHERPIEAVDYVKETCAESFRLAGKSPGFIAFLFLQRCLYDYAHLNLANDNYLDAVEESVLAQHQHAAAEIAIAGANILKLKKLAASLHIVLMLMVTKRSPFISNEGRVTFAEMLAQTVSIRAAIDSSRDLLDGIVANLQTAAAQKTNDIARVLTVISGILLPLTLIAGIYGMNFENMPELKWNYGYFGVLTLMIVVAAVLLFAFRRLGWIFRSGKAR
jgi:magnesium transporter